jgi:CBS domain-containing protein
MSQRAAWQLERLGFADVYDFVVGKAHWLASGRPTTRSEPIGRVGAFATPATTAALDDSVAAIRESTQGTLSDVVVVDERRIVLGRVRRSNLAAANATDSVSEIMQLGPTTIRPDELVSEVTKRMATRGVSSLLVTRPTGELIGAFVPTRRDSDE